jgi:hypothetical protein
MLTVILDSPGALVAVIAILSLVNYAVGALVLRDNSRQIFVEPDLYVPPGVIGKVQSNRARLALPFFLAIVIIVLTLLGDRLTREIIGGGYLVTLIAGLALNVTNVLTIRTLLNPSAAEGRIRYSAMYRYRSAAARMLGFTLFSGTVGILFSNLSFLAGAFLLFAAAIGYYRRARQASRRAV